MAPVTTQNATSRTVVFPKGASWKNIFDETDIVTGGVTKEVKAPLEIIPVFERM